MKKLFYLLFVLLLFVVACESNEEEPKVEAPVLALTSEATMEFAPEGGAGEIAYTLENAEEGVELTATTAAEWITDVAVAESVTFTVAANDGDAREAEIVVAYGEQSFDVVVKQAAAAVEPVVEGWAILGSMTNNWDMDAAVAMEQIEGYYVARGFELQASDTFIFVCNSDTANVRSGNGQPAERDHGYQAYAAGSDIRVKESGRYDIYLTDALDAYYVMSEGADPATAVAPELPVENTWGVLGNFEGNNFEVDVEMVKDHNFYIAQDVVFAAEGDLGFKIRKGQSTRDEHNYGARTKKVRELGEEIQLYAASDKGANNVLVNVERGVKYDIYFMPSSAKAWVMADGAKPEIEIKWYRVEGVLFAANNFGVFMYSDTHTLCFDFNSGVMSEDGTIPEGIYYVNDVDNTGNNFNELGDYTVLTIYGVDTYPAEGTLEIKHISGGYEIIVDMITAHREVLQTSYSGRIEGNQYMGRPITNPM